MVGAKQLFLDRFKMNFLSSTDGAAQIVRNILKKVPGSIPLSGTLLSIINVITDSSYFCIVVYPSLQNFLLGIDFSDRGML